MQGAPTPVKPEGPPSPKDRAGIANMILDNVRQDKDVSNFVTVRDNYNRIARTLTDLDLNNHDNVTPIRGDHHATAETADLRGSGGNSEHAG